MASHGEGQKQWSAGCEKDVVEVVEAGATPRDSGR